MSPHRCRVKLVGRSCDGHDLCVPLTRGVPPELRCEDSAPVGYGRGGGSVCGCQTPADLSGIVERELRDNLLESRRRGYVLVRAV